MPNESSLQSLSKLIEDLRSYQVDLKAQNAALHYSRMAAEGASERFESLFSNVPLALMVVDEVGMVIQSNAMALRLFRPSEQDPALNFLLPLVRSSHTEAVERALEIVKRDGQSNASEIIFSRSSQGGFTGDLHMARIRYAKNDQAHFICAIIDQGPLLSERRALNERRRALQESATALQQRNEELRLSENRLATIINSSLDAIICVDNDLLIRVFNPAAAILFQCPADQALHTPLERFLPEITSAMATMQVVKHAMLGEVVGQTFDGKALALEASVTSEHHPQGNITTIFARDLTAKKQVEAHRNILETQLRESQKMQAIGTMAGGIAHDFNNIISAILGNVTLAQQDTPVDAPALISLMEIDRAARRARDLVRQILTFSRNEVPKRSPIQIADVVEETARLLKVTLPPAVALVIHLKPTPLVLADATQIEQAVLNLCTNAIHACGTHKGTVSVLLDACHPPAHECERLGISPGSYVTVSVHDTGSGMSAQRLERIFEPFFTTKPVGQGTGLGLSVVHGIMQSHQGCVSVTSTPDVGSQFTLYFPVTYLQLPQTPPAAAETNALSGRGKHVLYVDDDSALVFLVERSLKRKGYTVSTFTDPHLAATALQDRAQDFDLLVTDYNMPGYSGVELLRMARIARPDLPVALASGYITQEIEDSALAEGARALIHKPNDIEELCATVQRLLQDGPPH